MKRRTAPAEHRSGAANLHHSGSRSHPHGRHSGRLSPAKAAKPRGTAGHLPSPAALSPGRVRFAWTAAVLGDMIQLPLVVYGLTRPSQYVSLALAALLFPALGPHLLLAAALVLEFVPNANVLPLWTACVALVLALRRSK